MTKFLLCAAAVFFIHESANAQTGSGPIAHWPMNGNATDATGNGHTGTMRSVTSATGKHGSLNTALYFDGTSSYIHIPYQPDLNLSAFSICATVKVASFNQGNCEVNNILSRGPQLSSGSYSLLFFDNAYNGCGVLDTGKQVFAAEAGSNYVPASSWAYSPNIASNSWYTVVATFDGSRFRVYVNGNLKSVSTTGSSLPIGTSTDGILIGRSDSTGSYPYPFNGYIDDIMLYNRALSEAEVAQYGENGVNVPEQTVELLRVFPNPAAGQLRIELAQPTDNAKLELFDVLGQLVHRSDISSQVTELSTGAFARGHYILRVQSAQGTVQRKITLR